MITYPLRMKAASLAAKMMYLFRSVESKLLTEYHRRRTIRILDSLQDDVLKDIGYRRYSGL